MRYFFAPIVASLLYLMPSDASAKGADSETVMRSTRDATHVVTPTHAAPVPSAASRTAADDQARYAAREADSTKAQSYRGGDTLVIGTTAAVVILAVILIIVLI